MYRNAERWSTICCVAGAVWSSAGIRTGPAVVRSVHGWVGPRCRHHELNLHQYADDIQVYTSTSAGKTEAAVGRLVSRRHRGLAEGQPAPTEPHQDPGDVIGFAATARQGERLRSSGGVFTYQRLGDGARPWRRHRQSAEGVCAGVRRVAVATISNGSSDRSSDPCHLTPWSPLNADACLVSVARWRDHITPVLRQLLWFPVRQRVNFRCPAWLQLWPLSASLW